MPITALYAALLAALLLVLSIRVIAGRGAGGPSFGVGDDPAFERRVRAQANFTEYAPIGLLCLLVLEIGGTPVLVLHALGLLLLAGRVLHGVALSFLASSPIGRTGGMALTLAMIGISAAMCLRVFLAA